MARMTSALLALAASASLAGCAYGPGYGGVSVGYGTGGYYDDYYGYDAPYYGWYDGYYYPGTGYYVYDRGGHGHKWNDRHRRHWEGRRHGRDGRENWGGYRRDGERDGRPEWGDRERGDRDDRGGWGDRGRGDRDDRGGWGDRQGRRDGRGPNAGVAGNPTPAAPGATSGREARADVVRGRPTNAGNRRDTVRATRPPPRAATREAPSADRPTPRNRSEAMRRVRNGDD